MLGDSLGELVPMGTGHRNIDPGAKVSGGGNESLRVTFSKVGQHHCCLRNIFKFRCVHPQEFKLIDLWQRPGILYFYPYQVSLMIDLCRIQVYHPWIPF